MREREHHVLHGAQKRAIKVSATGMTTDYISTCYENLKNGETRSHDSGSMWIRKGYRNVESFVSIGYLFSKKTATVMERTALAIYSVHSIDTNSSARRRQWIIEKGSTLV